MSDRSRFRQIPGLFFAGVAGQSVMGKYGECPPSGNESGGGQGGKHRDNYTVHRTPRCTK